LNVGKLSKLAETPADFIKGSKSKLTNGFTQSRLNNMSGAALAKSFLNRKFRWKFVEISNFLQL
jgi:hypothetical protein